MSNFYETQLIKTIDTDEEFEAGDYSFPNDMFLKNIIFGLYINNVSVTTERIRINYYNPDSDVLLISSNWVNLSDIENVTPYWLGRVRADFDGYFLDSDITYRFKIEVGNYSRNANVNYLGAISDRPYEINVSTNNGLAMGLEIYGY